MGSGWVKGFWVLAALGMASVAAADFVHVAPTNLADKSSDAIVPPAVQQDPALPRDVVSRPVQISTAPGYQSIVEQSSGSGQLSTDFATPAPQAAPQSPVNGSHEVRPLALGGGSTTPGVPEPPMLAIALIAAAGMVAWRRRERARAAAAGHA